MKLIEVKNKKKVARINIQNKKHSQQYYSQKI